MSLTFLGWLLIVTSIVIPALVAFSRSEQLPVDISARLKRTTLNETGARTERPDLSRLRWPNWSFGRSRRGAAATLMATAAAFVVVAGIGTATSYLHAPPDVTGSDTDDTILARLDDYTRSIGHDEPASVPAEGKLLPDVNTMIEQLSARLETAPADLQGWRMLGWSYFNMERYDEAAAAYAKAIELDPNSAEVKAAYESAKKAAEGNNSTASPLQTGAVGQRDDGPSVEKIPESGTPPHEGDAAIRSMVDGLADRLERAPRDVEGWTRLMRSRIVLGEREVATTAFRRALDVFKDDSAASSTIAAAATELGLKAE